MSRVYEPSPADTSKLVYNKNQQHNKYINKSYFSVVLSPELEEFVKAYAESVHDQWSYAKVGLLFKCLLMSIRQFFYSSINAVIF